MPIYNNPKELASLQSGKRFRGPGSAAKNQEQSEALKDTAKFISKMRLDIDASWQLTSEWRTKAEESYRFLENDQWDAKDRKIIESEDRFALTFNDMLPIIRILSGIERQKKESFKVLPREGGDVDAADIMTQLVSYVDDENLGYYQRIRKSNDTNITGRGYIKTDISYDENITGDIIIKRINPLAVFNDPMAEEWDGTDRRWVAEGLWVTEDEAKELWPDFAEQIHVGDWLKSNTGTMPSELIGDRLGNLKLFMDSATKRVRIFDYWYKQYELVTLAINSETGDVKAVDDAFLETLQTMDPAQRQVLQFARRKVSTIRIATICNWLLLQDKISPYSHRYFPITPYIGIQFYNEPWGIAEYLKDSQRLKNKAMSQAMNHLNRSANSGWLNKAADGADPKVLEAFGSKPGVVVNYESVEPKQIHPSPLSTAHQQLIEFSSNQIKNTSLVNAEIQGQNIGTRTVSGRAIQARQQGGLVGNEDLFDNSLLGDKLVGLQVISLIQDRFTPARVARIVENIKLRGGEASPMAQLIAQKKSTLPTIIDAALKEEYDYIIDRSGGGLTAREQLANTLTEMTKAWAQTGNPVPVSLIVATIKQTDIPDADKSSIIQEIQGMQQQAQAAAMMKQGGPGGPGMPPPPQGPNGMPM